MIPSLFKIKKGGSKIETCRFPLHRIEGPSSEKRRGTRTKEMEQQYQKGDSIL